MQTNKRLTEAYKKAFPVPFDQDSKFVFFGDTHRGDDSIADEFGRNRPIYYHALNHYYQNGFTYVELGDGDELIEHRHFRHIYNAHVPTFRSFYRTNTTIMCRVRIPHIKACPLSCQTTRTHTGQTTLVRQFRKRVHLVHQL